MLDRDDIQALLKTGYPTLRHATMLTLRFADRLAAQACLTAVRPHVPAVATPPTSGRCHRRKAAG